MFIVTVILIILSIPAILITGMNIYESKGCVNAWVVHYKSGKRSVPMSKEDALECLGKVDVSYIEKVYGYGKRSLYKYDNAASWWD